MQNAVLGARGLLSSPVSLEGSPAALEDIASVRRHRRSLRRQVLLAYQHRYSSRRGVYSNILVDGTALQGLEAELMVAPVVLAPDEVPGVRHRQEALKGSLDLERSEVAAVQRRLAAPAADAMGGVAAQVPDLEQALNC
jgi:hypothetical protein